MESKLLASRTLEKQHYILVSYYTAGNFSAHSFFNFFWLFAGLGDRRAWNDDRLQRDRDCHGHVEYARGANSHLVLSAVQRRLPLRGRVFRGDGTSFHDEP